MDAPRDFVDRLQDGADAFTEKTQPATQRDDTLPKWFAPKPPDAYVRFDSRDQIGSLFIDKETGRVFVYRNDF
jgi:hypothetical protein